MRDSRAAYFNTSFSLPMHPVGPRLHIVAPRFRRASRILAIAGSILMVASCVLLIGTEQRWWPLAPDLADSLLRMVVGTANASIALSFLLRRRERRGMWRVRTVGLVALLTYGTYSIARGAWPAIGIAAYTAILLAGLASAAIALGLDVWQRLPTHPVEL